MGNQDEISRLESQIKDLESKLEDAEDEIRNLNEEVSNLKAELKTAQEELEDAEREHDEDADALTSFIYDLRLRVARIHDAATFPDIDREEEIRLLIETILDFQD